jgi:RNA polymerase sigma-32 factor
MVEASDWSESGTRGLVQALSRLHDRSRAIVQARWMDEDNKRTLQDLADAYGVSAERIRQIENSALKKLRGYMAA